MVKLLKKIFIFLLIILFIMAFSNSYSTLNIDNLAYVLALGVDTTPNNTFRVTFQLSTSAPVSESGSGSGSQEKSPNIVNSVEASSLSSAINLLDGYLAKEVNLSHCKVFIFSEEVASQGISNEIYTLINNSQVRPSAKIIVSKCEAKTYIEQTTPQLENLVSKYYELISNSNKYTGYIPNSSVGDFFGALSSKDGQPYAILGGLNNTNTNLGSSNNNIQKDANIIANNTTIQGENGSENMGLAVFKGDRLVGELNALETLSFLAIKNEIKSFLVSIPDPTNEENIIDIHFTPYISHSIEVDTSTSSPHIKINAKFTGKVYSATDNSNYLSSETFNILSNSCNKYLESTFSSLLYKTAKEYNSDIFSFGRYALPNFKTTNEWNDYKWLDNYKNAFFDVNIKTYITSGMLIVES